jgi:imidazolonepropionase-like amidohydrolase
MPHLLAFSAFHVESEMIPVTRAAGVTHVLSRPRGGVVAGQAAVMSLAGWIPEEMEIRRRGALLINFPSQPGFQTRSFEPAPAARRPLAELRKEYEAAVRELGLFFDKGRHYLESKSKAPAEIQPDQRLDALLPALQGEEPVLISAQNHVDIKAAVEFAEKQKLNFVLLSANDAWRVADFLKEHRVRVILGPCQELPRRDDDPIDIVYRLPSILHAKGIPFAITSGTASDSRNLPHEAGNAVAYGLPREAALRAITLTPAELLGVADEVGSIDKGKRANLVVADGDIFEYQTRVKHLFINGRPVDLETKHSKLYEKYASRP